MVGYRENFLKSLHFFGNLIPTKLLVAITQIKLIVPLYHCVSDRSVDHIKYLYNIKNVKTFINDLDFLLKYYTPIDYHQLKEIASSGTEPKKNSFILTFDDGLREFYDIIAPILLQKGIPAICFLNSDFIDNKNIFYRYKASILANAFFMNNNLKKENAVIDWVKKNSNDKNSNITNLILSIGYKKKETLDSLAQIIELDFENYLLKEKPYLSAAQIKELISKGFYFGSHSCDHPEYQYLNLDEQINQTRKSTAEITKKLSLDYKTFAFPFTDYGVSKKYFEIILEKEKLVDLSFGSAGLKKELFPNHVQRIPFEISDFTAKEILNTDYLYYVFKSFFGKNTIVRK